MAFKLGVVPAHEAHDRDIEGQVDPLRQSWRRNYNADSAFPNPFFDQLLLDRSEATVVRCHSFQAKRQEYRVSPQFRSQAVNIFNPFGQEAPLQGLLLHLGVSAVYGAIFGLLQPLVPRRLPGWVAGLAYGLVLFGLAHYVLLPRAQVGMAELPTSALLLGHIVYGLVLGLGS